jgi:hypothetical protein
MSRRDALSVQRALQRVREFGERSSHLAPEAAPAAQEPQEPASQGAPGRADEGPVGLDHAEIV